MAEPRFHATPQGNIPFTPEEEAEWDVREAAWEAEVVQRTKDAKLLALSSLAKEKEEADLDMGAGLVVTMSLEDRTRLINSLSLFGRKPTETRRFKGVNGFTDIDKAGVEAIQDAFDARLTAITAQHEVHYNAINSLTTVQEIVDYDITTGW